jgi:hypothetical protein
MLAVKEGSVVREGDAGSDNAGFGGVNEIDRRPSNLLWASPVIETFGGVAANGSF